MFTATTTFSKPTMLSTSDPDVYLIPIRDCSISERIKEAVIAYKPDFDFSDYFVMDDRTFKLARMKDMMNDELYDTTDRPPISARKMYRGFRIDNGRHRVARALILGETHISAKLV
jgi:hypothetical protein